jgi:hypothetical protein
MQLRDAERAKRRAQYLSVLEALTPSKPPVGYLSKEICNFGASMIAERVPYPNGQDFIRLR